MHSSQKSIITRFSLSPKELNGWKASLTERLVECYIEQRLIPRLKSQEGLEIVIFSTFTWFSVPDSQGFNPDFKNERVFFLSNGLLPTNELLHNFETLTKTLENVPDGFLLKLKRTGESKPLRDGISEMGLQTMRSTRSTLMSRLHQVGNIDNVKGSGYAVVREIGFDAEECDFNQQLPVVKGSIEVVEVKSGKGNLASNQVQSYINVVKMGFPLRFFKVEIIDFKENQFEIRERLITNPDEIVTRIAL